MPFKIVVYKKVRESGIMVIDKKQNQDNFAMKIITQILAGAQAILNVSFDIQNCSKGYLSDAYKTFLYLLSVIEAFLPSLIRCRSRTGRPPYP
jgi:hypothetical protein